MNSASVFRHLKSSFWCKRLIAVRRKKLLQASHENVPKWMPDDGDEQTAHGVLGMLDLTELNFTTHSMLYQFIIK